MPARQFHESYGYVTAAQLRLYKKANISPSDHDMLIEYFGDNPDPIMHFIRMHPDNTAYHIMMLGRR